MPEKTPRIDGKNVDQQLLATSIFIRKICGSMSRFATPLTENAFPEYQFQKEYSSYRDESRVFLGGEEERGDRD